MTSSTVSVPKRLVLGSVLAISLLFGGCAKSPDELLIGRWYSESMTIRFRTDSGVVWNSRNGLAIGRYEFSSDIQALGKMEATPNLMLDVIRRDERSKFEFEAKLLGKDRLQLKLLSTNDDDVTSTQSMVLRRANDQQLGGGTQVSR